MTDYAVRPYRSTDEGFVVSSWLRSYANSAYGRRFAANGKVLYGQSKVWDEHRPVVADLIRTARVDVLCDISRDDQIYAWACTEPDVVHYACVKMSAVGAGFGKEMLEMLFGDRLRTATVLSHEPVWTRHARETREEYERSPQPALTTENGAPLPYYYQPAKCFFPLPTNWKLDENYLARRNVGAA